MPRLRSTVLILCSFAFSTLAPGALAQTPKPQASSIGGALKAVEGGAPARLKGWVEALCAPGLAGRQFTKPGAREAAEYLALQFKALGLSSLSRQTPYLQPFVEHWSDMPVAAACPNPDAPLMPGMNVLGLLKARSPHANHQTVIVEAHFDHLGPLSPGASDNAAGVASMLEIARSLTRHPEKLTRDVLFASFDGEEMGWVGSTAYCKHPAVPLKQVAAFIVLDAMGRPLCDLPERQLLTFGAERSQNLEAQLQKDTAHYPQFALLGTDLIGDRSDYVPFRNARIPYLFFSNGTHKDYHNLGDTPDKLNYEGLESDTQAIRQVVAELATAPTPPTFRTAVALPGEADRVKALWGKVHPLFGHLPSIFKRDIPFLDPQVAALKDPVAPGTPARGALQRAIDLVFFAGTPWYGQLLADLEQGAAAEKRGDRPVALANYRDGAHVARTYAGIAFCQAKVKALSQAAPIKGKQPDPMVE
jgi:hypothetical protein